MGTAAFGSSRSIAAGMDLASGDEEKVSNIVEICNVTFDEALRVLDACRKDEALAIERFLNGTEDTTWSQVSKKKRPPTGFNPGKTVRSQQNSSRTSVVETPRSRSNNLYHPEHSVVHTKRQPMTKGTARFPIQQAPPASQSAKRQTKARLKMCESNWQSPKSQVTDPSTLDHSWCPPAGRNSQPDMEHSSKRLWRRPTHSVTQSESPQREAHHNENKTATWSSVGSSQARTWTADSSKSGLHWKPKAQSSEGDLRDDSPARTCPHTPSDIQVSGEGLIPKLASEQKEQRSALSYVAAASSGTTWKQTEDAQTPTTEVLDGTGAANKVQHAHELSPPKFHDNLVTKLQEKKDVISLRSSTAADCKNEESSTSKSTQPRPNVQESTAVWNGTPPEHTTTGERRNGDNPGIVSRNDSAPQEASAKQFSLQFGSFGLNGLDEVQMWSEKANITSQKPCRISVSTKEKHKSSSGLTGSGTMSVDTAVGRPQNKETTPQTSNEMAEISGDDMRSSRTQANRQSSVSSGAASGASTLIPMLTTGHGGSFPAPNYGTPFMIPPLHSYSPILGNYDNPTETGNSCQSGMPLPGCLPTYDHHGPPSGVSAGAKYGSVPGLNNANGIHGQGSLRKDSMAGTEVDKSPIASTSTTLGTESMNPSYMLPTYPSLQYPMYPYPNASPYAPPGIATHGPNAFPFHTGGQIPSHGARNMFGFEDVAVQLGATSRAPQEVGESMYTAGPFFNSTGAHHVTQKPIQEVGFKSVRNIGTNSGSISGVNIAGGIVHGIHYSDYVANPPANSNNGVMATSTQGEWKSLSRNGSRGETVLHNGTGIQGGGSSGTAAYVLPNGAQGAYWTPAPHAGYYP